MGEGGVWQDTKLPPTLTALCEGHCGVMATAPAHKTSPHSGAQDEYGGGTGGAVWGGANPHPLPRYSPATPRRPNNSHIKSQGTWAWGGIIAGGVGVIPWPLANTLQGPFHGGGGVGRGGWSDMPPHTSHHWDSWVCGRHCRCSARARAVKMSPRGGSQEEYGVETWVWSQGCAFSIPLPRCVTMKG